MCSIRTRSSLPVALLAEGVDRNYNGKAWVAMTGVALLAEGVDRNTSNGEVSDGPLDIALLAEGVDRNAGAFAVTVAVAGGRPPRGGRG